jgi:hypothetical protein
MEENFNLNQLLQKPIAMMTGEELCFLITKSVEASEKPSINQHSKGNYYGIEGIARFSDVVSPLPTASKRALIDKAISQLGRKIVWTKTLRCLWQGIRWNPY